MPEEAYVTEKMKKTNEEWKKDLTDEQYYVTRQKGTERPFTGKHHDNKEKGMYKCVCCGEELFSSDTKFESGTRWPSFSKPAHQKIIKKKGERSPRIGGHGGGWRKFG